MRRVRSGASNWRPSELAYLRRIISRTSSTRSSSFIVTSVAEAPGRLTQILRMTMLPLMGSSCSLLMLAFSSPWDPRSRVWMRVDCLLERRDCRRTGAAGLELTEELRASGELGVTVPLGLYAALGDRFAAEGGTTAVAGSGMWKGRWVAAGANLGVRGGGAATAGGLSPASSGFGGGTEVASAEAAGLVTGG